MKTKAFIQAAWLGIFAAGFYFNPFPARAQHDHHDHHGHGEGHEEDAHDDGGKSAQITVHENGFELFIEHPYPVAGEPAKFVTHVTDMTKMSARTSGTIKFILTPGRGGSALEQIAPKPDRPGIYMPRITFPTAGKWTVALDIDGTKVNLPPITVYASDDEVEKAPEQEEAEGFALLKEQQWMMPFKVEQVKKEGPKLLISSSAIHPEGDENVVFLRVAGETYAEREIIIGAQESDKVEVLSGLSEGEWIVTQGVGLAAEAAHQPEDLMICRIQPAALKTSGITYETLEKRPLAASFTAPARVSYNMEAMAHVGVALEGRVAEIKVRLGDRVKKGDPLLTVNSPELGEAQSDLLQKRTAIQVAKSSVEVTQGAYERAQKLALGKGISQAELLKREGEFKSAKGALLSAEAEKTAAENKLHLLGMTQGQVDALVKSGKIAPQYTVHAPIDGTVIEREVTQGEILHPDAKEPLMVLADTSTLWVLVNVPEARIRDVVKGSKAQILLAAMNGQSLQGTVSYISPSLDPQTRSGQVRVEISGDDAIAIQPGMFGEAELSSSLVAGAEEIVVVPEEAIQMIEGSSAVFVPVKDGEGVFVRRPIKTGARMGRWVPVIEGVHAGEKVVVGNSFLLKAEMGKAGAEHSH